MDACLLVSVHCWVCTVLVFTFLTGHAALASPCDFWEGSAHLDGYCYKAYSSALSWHDGQALCKRETHTGKLAEPWTEERLTFVLALLRARNPYAEHWIGARWNDQKRSYLWSSTGVTLTTDPKYWSATPFNPQSASGDTCSKIDAQQILNGDQCHNQKFVVCEQSAEVNPCYFWEGSSYFKGSCYQVFQTPATWSQAQNGCDSEIDKGKLAEPETEQHLSFVRQLVMFSDASFWIGGYQNMTQVWVTSGHVINTKSWDTGQPNVTLGNCVEINGRGWRLLASQNCSSTNPFVCEKYIGDLCEDSLPEADYFAGYCFKFHNTFKYWSQAVEACKNERSIVAETQTTDVYKYLKQFANKVGEVSLKIARNTTYLNLKEFGIPAHDLDKMVLFRVKACEDARVALWRCEDGQETMGGSIGQHYEIWYGSKKNAEYSLLLCNTTRSTCRALVTQRPSTASLKCDEFIEFKIDWSAADNLKISRAGLNYNFAQNNLQMLPINRVAVAMGNGNGEWLFAAFENDTDIFLGATDIDHEGYFTWVSNDQPVIIDDWTPGEPNDWTGSYGEDQLIWRSMSKVLNDVNGTFYTSARFICQRDADVHQYFIVLPKTDKISQKQAQLFVTTTYAGFVYLKFIQRSEGELTRTWTGFLQNLYQIELNSSLGMEGSGKYLSSLEIRSNHLVTVLLYRISNGQVSVSLALPVTEWSMAYYVLSHSSPSSGSQLSVTAARNGTQVLVKLPKLVGNGIEIAMPGYSYSQPRSCNSVLDEGESLLLALNAADLSGAYVYADHPVAVYAGPAAAHSQGREQTTDAPVSTVLPVYTTSSQYITFPTVPVGDGVDMFKILAIYDNTEITVHTVRRQNVMLQRSGQVETITLPRDAFYYIESELPFSVVKVGVVDDEMCSTPLLPPTLWSAQYSFHLLFAGATVIVILPTRLAGAILLNDNPQLATCLKIEGTEVSGCYFPLANGSHNLRTSDPKVKFAAYVMGLDSGKSVYCSALGADRFNVSYEMQTFAAEMYVQLSECAIFTSLHNDTNSTILTMEDILSDDNDSSTIPTSTSTTQETLVSSGISSNIECKTTPTSTATTQSMSPSTVAVDNTVLKTNDHTTSSTLTTLLLTSASENPPATSVILKSQVISEATSSSPVCPPTNPIVVLKVNLSQEAIEELSYETTQQLFIETKNTSAYRRKKNSIADWRTSSTAIGLFGVTVIATWVLILSCSDITTLVLLIARIVFIKIDK